VRGGSPVAVNDVRVPSRTFWTFSGVTMKPSLKSYLWPILSLVAIGLAHYVILDYGAEFGLDNWVALYGVDHGTPHYMVNRLFDILPLYLGYHIFGFDIVAFGIVRIVATIATAIVFFLVIYLATPDDPVFAFVAAVFLLVFNLDDLHQSLQTVAYRAAILQGVVVLAFLFYRLHLNTRRVYWLVLGLMLAGYGVLVKEATYPLLIGMPVLEAVLRRDFSRQRIISLALWGAVTTGFAMRYVLPLLGLTRTTYGSGLFIGLNLKHIFYGVSSQIGFVYKDLVFLQMEEKYLFPALLVIGIVLASITWFRKQYAADLGNEASHINGWRYTVWFIVGAAGMLLGIAAFVPTQLINTIDRVHSVAIFGEGLIVVALIWLVSYLIKNNGARWLVRYAAIALVVAYGTVQRGWVQDQHYYFEAQWESEAQFLRTLAYTIPAVEENTLIILIENPALHETPFTNGAAFEYAVRYVYQDRAEGLISNDTLLAHNWEASDAGISITPDYSFDIEGWPGTRNTFHRWDEIIFITRLDNRQVAILDEIPEEFYTEDRAAQYNPYGLIKDTYISQRVMGSYPPVFVLKPAPGER
jgi:hypothetical protein